MKVLSAAVLLLAVSGLALGFTDLIRAGTNAARGSISASNNLLGQSFVSGRRQNGQQNGASGNGQQAISGRSRPNAQQNQVSSSNFQQLNPSVPLVVSTPPVESRNEGRSRQNAQQNQVSSSNSQQQNPSVPLVISARPVESRNEDLAQSLGGGPNSAMGSAISSARNAANSASSLTALTRVTSALSLASILTNPWVSWIVDWCTRLYLSVSPYLVALSIPRLI